MKKIFILGGLLAMSCFSITSFAAKETITVKNNTGFPVTAIFKAVGCVHSYDTDNYHSYEVCHTKDLKDGESESYQFGGGTSGRHVFLAPKTGNMNMLDDSVTAENGDQDYIDDWNDYYENQSFTISNEGYKSSNGYVIYADSSCDHKFGITENGTTTWTKIDIKTYGKNQFKAYCH